MVLQLREGNATRSEPFNRANFEFGDDCKITPWTPELIKALQPHFSAPISRQACLHVVGKYKKVLGEARLNSLQIKRVIGLAKEALSKADPAQRFIHLEVPDLFPLDIFRKPYGFNAYGRVTEQTKTGGVKVFRQEFCIVYSDDAKVNGRWCADLRIPPQHAGKRAYHESHQDEIAALKKLGEMKGAENLFPKIWDDYQDIDEKQSLQKQELCARGSLCDYLVQDNYNRMSTAERKRFLLWSSASLLDQLDLMHEIGLAHGDMTNQNMLLTENMHLKLSDFGAVNSRFSSWHTYTPERWLTLQRTGEVPAAKHKDDVWAAGLILFELLTGIRDIPWKYLLMICYRLELLANKINKIEDSEMKEGNNDHIIQQFESFLPNFWQFNQHDLAAVSCDTYNEFNQTANDFTALLLREDLPIKDPRFKRVVYHFFDSFIKLMNEVSRCMIDKTFCRIKGVEEYSLNSVSKLLFEMTADMLCPKDLIRLDAKQLKKKYSVKITALLEELMA